MSTIVIVTEKNSVTTPLVKALIPDAKKNNDTHTGKWNGHDLVITQTNGHLYTVKEPGDYNPQHKKWVLEDLPFPISSEYKVIPGKEQLAKNVKKAVEAQTF